MTFTVIQCLWHLTLLILRVDLSYCRFLTISRGAGRTRLTAARSLSVKCQMLFGGVNVIPPGFSFSCSFLFSHWLFCVIFGLSGDWDRGWVRSSLHNSYFTVTHGFEHASHAGPHIGNLRNISTPHPVHPALYPSHDYATVSKLEY